MQSWGTDTSTLRRFSLSNARLLAALFLLGGCTTAEIIDVPDIPVKSESLQVIALVFSQEAIDMERQASHCIRTALEIAQLRVRVVSPEEFRQIAFPDLAPESAIHSSEYLSILLTDQRFRDRIAPLRIRYIISISGVTEQSLVGAGAGAMAGLIVWDRRSRLRASVLDLTRASLQENISADASGNPWVLIVGGLPLFIPADTDSQACRDFGGSIVKFLKKAASEP